MTVTGNLREVMKESISAAASYVRSRAVDFGIEPPLFDRRDIHVHVPEEATPKDGPSAVAMVTAIVGDDRHSDAPRRCDDRRDHAARSRVADQHALSVPLGPRDQARGCRFLAGMTSIRSSAQPGTPHPAAAVGTSLRQIVDSPVGVD